MLSWWDYLLLCKFPGFQGIIIIIFINKVSILHSIKHFWKNRRSLKQWKTKNDWDGNNFWDHGWLESSLIRRSRPPRSAAISEIILILLKGRRRSCSSLGTLQGAIDVFAIRKLDALIRHGTEGTRGRCPVGQRGGGRITHGPWGHRVRRVRGPHIRRPLAHRRVGGSHGVQGCGCDIQSPRMTPTKMLHPLLELFFLFSVFRSSVLEPYLEFREICLNWTGGSPPDTSCLTSRIRPSGSGWRFSKSGYFFLWITYLNSRFI